MSGFIRLSRNFFDNPYWKQQRTFSFSEAWLDLIQSARFEEEPAHVVLASGRELTINRGQLRASLRFLAQRWGWGVEKTQRFINKHIEKQELIRTIEQGESIITLCNYEKYNPLTNTNPDTGRNGVRNGARTPGGTNNKKEKERKEDNKEGGNGTRFSPPTQEELSEFISGNGYKVNSETFYNFYQSKNWYVGKNKMKDWRAAVRTWNTKEKSSSKKENHASDTRTVQRTHIPADTSGYHSTI